ncbi:unnamed protein product [Symbiodinium natans]|uniref:Uncharacterized protein n=1 Tax=Symbiodinium natans TaxID=878477 RepID=A0A812N7L6_9DINO|nr:unnamed protein product [Symbiodinium natans]
MLFRSLARPWCSCARATRVGRWSTCGGVPPSSGPCEQWSSTTACAFLQVQLLPWWDGSVPRVRARRPCCPPGSRPCFLS